MREKAPELLKEVGEFLPDKGGLGIIKNIIAKAGPEKINPVDKETLMDIIKYDLEFDKQITERWRADMNSDSWLSKNVRPIVLLYSWFLITVLCILAWAGYAIPESYVSLITELAVIVNIAFFGLRTLEKRGMKAQNPLKQ